MTERCDWLGGQVEKVEEPEEEEAEKKADDEDEEVKVEEEEEKKPKKEVERTVWDWVLINENKPLWTKKSVGVFLIYFLYDM